MKNAITGALLFIGGFLMLWGPYLLTREVPNWGAIMMLGMFALGGAIFNHWLYSENS